MNKTDKAVKTFIGTFIFFMLYTAGSAFAAENKVVYISPNNDGVQDELVVPLKISDKSYVSEWAFIVTDDTGTTVRTIGNKEVRPEKLTFKTFFKQLFKPKEGILIPPAVIWNGITDSGQTAADGTYFYYVTASDYNGNLNKTPLYTVIVDNTEPEIELVQPSESVKTFGAGNKPEIAIKQSGSAEDLWQAEIVDNTGKVVRNFSWKNTAPETCIWDGKNNEGIAVGEGVYTYRIFAADRAGNVSAPAQVTNIIYDAVPRSVNMTVAGSPFSPNGDGVKDSVVLTLSMPNSSGLLNWTVGVRDKSGTNLRTFSGKAVPPSSVEFDGKSDAGSVLPDGDYQLVFSAAFNNGQESQIARNITVDNTPPSASVRAEGLIFSPDGDGRLDTLTFSQEGSKEKGWSAVVADETGKTVKSWSFGETPASSVVWDGTASDGRIIDGFYTYSLFTTDLAGNTGRSQTPAFELNTGTTEVILAVGSEAFSPNGDKVMDTISFTPRVKTAAGIASYELKILDSSGRAVKTFSEKRNLPGSINWNGIGDDGKACADGMYTASLYTLSKNGSEAVFTTKPFELDTVYPSAAVSAPYTLFSPNGDGLKDSVDVSVETSSEKLWTALITDKAKNEVRSFSWTGQALAFSWDGKDEAGNTVADGSYTLTLSSTDEAGNKGIASINDIRVDNRSVKLFVTAERDGFSPNGDGFADNQQFNLRTTLNEGIEKWSFTVKNADSGTPVYRRDGKADEALPALIQWDGTGVDGRIAEGTMSAVLSVDYAKGDSLSASTAPFLCSVTPPRLTVRTTPEYFSPDNDGVDDDLFIALKGTSAVPFTGWSFEINDPNNGKNFWKTSGKSSITERIIWDGRGNGGELVQSAVDYPYKFTVTDSLGMTSTVEGIISVDVLVIRMGDVLKMQVPSIIFRSDNADFAGKDKDPKRGLDQRIIDNNYRVLKRIAQILEKFRDYNVTIEGHANNISGTEKEETSTENGNIPLVPLSEQRAATVKDILVSYGIASSRLTTVGRGGRMPVAAHSDRDNWWKNRRVEFILNK
ncbi:FlgD immunoglobulin-like domain containing protein [Treponema sp. HNW]|uniref:FlgD immunoglobulin-like domain containing protein n=1 Tax=Treponema sp. HNW TaxID=3116654 RepID=UPI003D0A0022